jgi:hypothetical protein
MLAPRWGTRTREGSPPEAKVVPALVIVVLELPAKYTGTTITLGPVGYPLIIIIRLHIINYDQNGTN